MRRASGALTSFRGQIMVSTVCLVAFAMVLLSLGVQLVLKEAVSHNVDRVLEDRADAVVKSIEAASDNRLTVPAGALDPGIVVYDENGAVVAGSVSSRLTGQVRDLRTVRATRTVDHGETERLLAVPFDTRSSQRGVVVVTERLTPYEQAERYALLACIALGIIVTGAAGLIARWVTGRALAPVAKMASRAADWSEHDLGHRFELGDPTNEIAALGATLDHLLDRVAMAIHAEQRLTSELAHELRTPWPRSRALPTWRCCGAWTTRTCAASIPGSPSPRPRWPGIISTLLDISREGASSAPHLTCLANEVLADAAGETRGGAASVGVVLELRSGGFVGADRGAAGRVALRAIRPLVDNALQHASVAGGGGGRGITPDRVELVVSDDGPGVGIPRGVAGCSSPGSHTARAEPA